MKKTLVIYFSAIFLLTLTYNVYKKYEKIQKMNCFYDCVKARQEQKIPSDSTITQIECYCNNICKTCYQ